MNLQEILAAVQQLTAEEQNTVFTTLGDAMDTLPKEIEQKFLARKNKKITEREARITELETQVTGFEDADKLRSKETLNTFIATQGRTHKVVSALTKDFARAAKEALKENSKLGEAALEQEAVIKTLLTDNKHYTNASVSSKGVVIVEDDKNKKPIKMTSSKDILRNAQNKNK